MTFDPRSGLSPEDETALRDKSRMMVGLGVLRQIQVLARKYQEEQAFKRRAATTIAIVCAIVVAGGALLFFAAPGVLAALFRSLS